VVMPMVMLMAVMMVVMPMVMLMAVMMVMILFVGFFR